MVMGTRSIVDLDRGGKDKCKQVGFVVIRTECPGQA